MNYAVLPCDFWEHSLEKCAKNWKQLISMYVCYKSVARCYLNVMCFYNLLLAYRGIWHCCAFIRGSLSFKTLSQDIKSIENKQIAFPKSKIFWIFMVLALKVLKYFKRSAYFFLKFRELILILTCPTISCRLFIKRSVFSSIGMSHF